LKNTPHSSQKVEMTQKPVNGWMNNQNNTSIQRDNIYSDKGMRYWYLLQHDWTLKILC
jgi:hypothetical protein